MAAISRLCLSFLVLTITSRMLLGLRIVKIVNDGSCFSKGKLNCRPPGEEMDMRRSRRNGRDRGKTRMLVLGIAEHVKMPIF